ncbi:MAG: endo-1,4-beta-xylanase [Ignavibacteriales bacterium]|nr:endo-1,4-beta-xylanase [Ignavibacteriales bacterium]
MNPWIPSAAFSVAVMISGFGPQTEKADQPILKDAFGTHFLIGGALNDDVVAGKDPDAALLVQNQFNTITPENVMKWALIHPEPARYDFDASDRLVAFGRKNTMVVIGHTLVWHNQTPGWVFEDGNGKPLDRETLLERMRDHIHTIVGRYKGTVQGWDVVNEALDEDGSLRQAPWMKIIGEDYIARAFQFAHEADPEAELYYNDFSLENEPKRNGALALVRKLQSQKIRITGVGLQGHYKMDWPSPMQVQTTIEAFAGLGMKVMITELDMDVLPDPTGHQGADLSIRAERREELDPYTGELPDSLQFALAERYAELFRVFVGQSDKLSRVTFWGVYDKTSWLNNWPVRGRTNHPLLFDRNYRPKPAFLAVIKTGTREK